MLWRYQLIIKLSPLFVVEIRVKNVPNDKYGPNGILFEVSIFFMPTKIIIINAADPKLRYNASIDSFEPKNPPRRVFRFETIYTCIIPKFWICRINDNDFGRHEKN